MERIWLAVCLCFMLRMMIMMMLLRLFLSVCWLHAHHQIGNHSELGEPKRIHWTNKLIDTFLYFGVLFTIASPSFIRSFILSFCSVDSVDLISKFEITYLMYLYMVNQKRVSNKPIIKHHKNGLGTECDKKRKVTVWTLNVNRFYLVWLEQIMPI